MSQDILYIDKRPLNRSVMAYLANCWFVDENRSIVFHGYPSSGKTFLGCAVAKEACRQRHKTKYIRLPDLLGEYADKSLLPSGRNKVLNKFILELTERRFDCTSTIFCTLYKRNEWVARLGRGTYAESIVERFAYNTTWVDTGNINMNILPT